MLNIHSFLLGTKKRIQKSMNSCYKASLLVAGYTLVAIVILLGSNRSQDKEINVIEAYANAGNISGTFAGTYEETAKKANIRADQDLESTVTEKDNLSDVYSIGTINGMVVKAIDQAYQDQQELEIEEARARRLAEEKAKKEEAAKEAAKIEAQKKRATKEAAVRAVALKKASAKSINISASEKEVLQRIVEAEATGEDLKGRILVANVILNRVKSSQFPDTVKDVVFQKNGNNVQFSPTRDGRYWSVNISAKTKEAVEKALAGTDYSKGALYFSARDKADPNNMSWFDTHLTRLFRYGGHEFYK